MTATDFVTFLLSVFFMLRGYSRGLMDSLLMPLSVILAAIISIIYYQLTKEIIITLALGLTGPFLLNILFKFLLKTWEISINANVKPDFLNRLGGAIVTLVWGWVFIVITLITLSFLPPWGEALQTLHNDVTTSGAYQMAKPWKDKFFMLPPSSPEVKSLAQDPRFQTILQDPKIQQEIDAHDLAKLMRNPKIMNLTQEIINDPSAMKKIMAFYSSQAPSPKNE